MNHGGPNWFGSGFPQVRTIVTETAFSIDELEELFVLFKVDDWA